MVVIVKQQQGTAAVEEKIWVLPVIIDRPK